MTSAPSTCVACGAATGEVMFTATDHREGLGGRFALLRCGRCSLVRTDPRPENLAEWYSEGYGPHEVRASASVRAAERALRYLAGPARSAAVARCLGWLVPGAHIGPPLRPGDAVLDVGAGSGGAVHAMRLAGLDAWGVEPSEAAVAAAERRGVATVRLGTIESAEFVRERQWELVRFTHVLEHVPDPIATLRTAREVLAPGGRIVVLVPNFGGAGRRAFRASWDGLELPRHLHHFTRSSLTDVMHRAELRVAAIRTGALFGLTAGSLDALSTGGTHQRGWGRSLALRGVLYPLELGLSAVGLGDALVVEAQANDDERSAQGVAAVLRHNESLRGPGLYPLS